MPLTRHTTYKPGPLRQIKSEVPVCRDCSNLLLGGYTTDETRKAIQVTQYVEALAVAPSRVNEIGENPASFERNGAKDKQQQRLKAIKPVPRCDVCSEVIKEGEGQVTAESTLCSKHLPKQPKRRK